MPKNPAFDDKLTFLMACSYNRTGDVLKLIDQGVDVDAPDSHNMTGLHYATLNGHTDMVGLLLDKDANPNLQDRQKSTPLHMAVSSRSEKIARLLLEKGADPDLRDANGETPAELAASCNNADLANIIVTWHKAIQKEKSGNASRKRLQKHLEMLDQKFRRHNRRNNQPGTK